MNELDALNIQRRFGARVRQLRESAGLSQEESALRAGLDRSYIGQVERGERNLSLVNIYKIAAGLDLSPQELFLDPIGMESRDVP